MDEKVIIRKAKLNDFSGVHKLIMQVHRLHVSKRNDIYKDIDPMNFEEFKTELSNSNNIYLIAELGDEIVGICFSQIKEILNNKIMKNRKILYKTKYDTPQCKNKANIYKSRDKSISKNIIQPEKDISVKISSKDLSDDITKKFR